MNRVKAQKPLSNLSVGEKFKTIGGSYKILKIEEGVFKCKCIYVGIGVHKKGDIVKFKGNLMVSK